MTAKASPLQLEHPAPEPVSFVDILRRLAATRGNDTAITFLDREESGGSAASYAMLDERARTIAAALQASAAPGERAVLMLETGLSYVTAFFGGLYAGVLPVPAFPPEARRTQHTERLRAILRDAAPKLVLVHAGGEEAALQLVAEEGLRGATRVMAVEGIGSSPSRVWTPPAITGDDLALLQYTSGSTSEPKGVMVSHGNLIANARSLAVALAARRGDCAVSWLPLYHGMGLMSGLLQPFHAGVPLVLMPPQLFLGRPLRWLEAISRYRGTFSGGPDFAYRLCVDRVSEAAIAGLDLSSWQLAFSGSETVRADTLRAFAAKFQAAGFDARAFYPCYGQAEATLFVTGGARGGGMREMRFDAQALTQGVARPVPEGGVGIVACGCAKPGHEIVIADPETGAPLPGGHIGEIWTAGPVVTQGYWRKPEATAEAFVTRHGRRFLRSGDLGFLHDGELHIAGRRKDIIIIRGQNLYPQDIEQMLDAELDILRSGRIAAFPVELDGREGIGVAVEISRGVQKLTQPEVLARLISETVSAAFFEPARVVALLNPGGLPRTSSGKLQRAATRQGWTAGTLDAYAVIVDGALAGASESAPAPAPAEELTATQQQLAAIWREVLSRDAVALDDSFFMLGGNSIDAVQMLTRIADAFDVELDAAALFSSTTLRELADAVDRARLEGRARAWPRITAGLAGSGEAAPLSYAQRRMWFLRELGGDGAVHHIAGGLRLTGVLDRAALQAALNGLAARHGALRTVFRRLPDGEAEQVVREAGEVPLGFEDLSTLPEAARQARLDALSAGEARTPFDLETGPLLRATLMRLRPDSHVLLLTMHHIVSDGWSVRILLGELLRLYGAACRGETANLPPVPIRYADYAAWQRDLIEAGALAPQLAFWRETLGEAPVPPLALPFDRPRPAVATNRGGRLSFALDADLAAKLRHLAAGQSATLVTVLLAAFDALLWRYTGTADLRVGLPVAGRNRRETEGVIGLFVNTLVVRAQVDGAASFADLVAGVRDRLITAQANQDLPFEQLVEALSPGRDLSHSPLVQVMYNHLPLAMGALSPTAGLAVELFARESGGQQFDLVLETEETADGGLAASFGYASDLFHGATIARMARHFTALLEAVASNPEVRLDAIDLVGADELAALSAPHPFAGYSPEPVHRLISAQAARRPDAAAVICGETTLSFAELEAQANRLAWHLLRRGIRREDRIGVMMERSSAQVAALLAVLKAGAAFLPLDAGQPPARLAQTLADVEVSLVLTETALADKLPGGTPMLALDALDLGGQSSAAPDVTTHPEQLAYLITTSGSTGTPKAVAVAHGPLSRHCQATAAFYEMDERARELHVLSFAFDGAHERWITPLILGGAIVLRGPELWDAQDTLAAMAKHRVSNAGFPAALLQQIAGFAAQENAPPPPLRMLSFGGEAMPRGGFETIKRALKPGLLINGYGPTEAVISPLAWKATSDQGFEGAYAPIGRAIGRRRAYVLDAGLNPVPQGVAGELYIGGDIARGYHGRPGLTAERFLPDPFAGGGARMYRTGDRVRLLPDGSVDYLGRLDAQMKLRGFRIEPGEIEARLLDHETVSAAAIALHNTPAGPRLTGYVVPAPGASPDPATLRASLARALPAYMVPARILIIDTIPLTATGKIDRAALPLPPAEDAAELNSPATELEAQLAAIWQDTLKLAQIGTNQNFFELGGDSILSLQIVARARRAGLFITPGDLFRHQTVAELAAIVRAEEQPSTPPAASIGPAPLTPIQSWFFAEAIPHRGHWNQRVALTPNTPLDPASLSDALHHLIGHHEALRLRFWQEDGAWRQAPAPPGEVGDPLWRRNAASDADLARLASEADRSLDLRNGQLLRAVLAQFPDGDQRLLLSIHHLAVDGVSWRILIEDLEALYAQLAAGSQPRLSPPAASFTQWAQHLAERADSPALAEEAGYWARLSTGIAPLPQNNPAGANRREHARRVTVRLPAGAASQLLAGANTAYRTRPDELMLTALARAVSRWTGQPEILVDLEGHGRDLPGATLDVSRTIGWFTTVFPVRLAGHGDLPRAIKAVKEAVRRTPGKGAGYGLIRHLGAPEAQARLAGLPSAQIAFNYLGRMDAASSGLLVADIASMDLSTDAAAPLGPLITIDALAGEDGLTFRWTYSGEMYRAATIESLAGSMLDELAAITAHCADERVQGVTPADFPVAGLTQAQLDRLALPWRQVEDMHRLTPLQQGMLFHDLYAPEETAYVNQLRLTIDGLDLPRFIAAWRAAIGRHGTLRSGFIRDDELDAPRQVVFRMAELAVHEEDWRGRTIADADLAAFAAGQRHGFDLTAPPLMRLAFIRTGETRHHMVWTCHHLLLDGWSNALLLAEVLKRYAEPDVRLPTPTFRFRDYIAWLETRDSLADERFWRDRLRSLEDPTLIAEAFTGKLGAPGSDTHATPLDAERMARLTAFARRERITLNTLIQAAWLLTLKRYTRRNRPCFGMTVAGRPADLPGIDTALGLFINTVPVTSAIPPGRPVGAWLRSLQDEATELREHDHAPLAEIQRWAGQGGRALFDSLLVFENYPVDAALRGGAMAGLCFDAPHSRETTNYPLTLSIFTGEHAALHWSYARASFTAAGVAEIEQRFLLALDSLAGDAAQPVGAVSLALPTEIGEAHAHAAARRSVPAGPPVHRRFAEQARLAPNAVALTLGDDSLTYAALDERANRLANRLLASGVAPGSFVGLAAERSFGLVAGILAVLKAGAAYVPLDPAYPMERLAFMAADAKLSALLAAPDLAGGLAQGDVPVISLDEAASAQFPEEAPDVRVAPQSPAYVIYTSGSTGKPKGVVVSHENVARLFAATQDWFGFGPRDVWTLFHSYAFDFSVWETFGALCHGGRLVIVPHFVSRSPDEFLRLLVRERVTVLNQTPSAFRQLMRAATQEAGKPDLALRTIIFGGEALEIATLRPWFERFGDAMPCLVNMYGITETTVHVTYRPIVAADLDGGANSPIGQPIPDLTLHVLDDALDPAPAGVAGELYVGGAGLASGYFGRPGLTAERFLPDPFGGGDGRLYRTGDKAMRLADGAVEYLGRLDSQVKIRGFRIELGEIEARLLAEPGVTEAAVILRDEVGGPQLFAYVVARGQIEPEAIKASLRRQLPDYMAPAHIMAIAAMPLTENGKLNRRALPAPRHRVAKKQPPRTETERRLAAIWRDVLGVEGAGPEDNFFDLGGHSLLAVQMHLQIGREFGVELPLRTLFEGRGLGLLAEAIDARLAADGGDAEALREMAALMDDLEG